MNFLDDIKLFSKCRLKKVETRVHMPDGCELIESRNKDGDLTVRVRARKGLGYIGDIKPDLQIGKVLPFLSIGSQDVAHEFALLKAHGVTHLLNLATGVPNAFEGSFVYKQISLLDLPDVNIREVFDECFQFIDAARDGRGHAFVHCNAGVSRSATVVIAYVMKHCRLRYVEARLLVEQKRPAIRPNDGFTLQLKTFDSELFLASSLKCM